MKSLPVTILLVVLALTPGCTRHRVEVRADEPIVIRVEARIDIYNHAAEIEDMVSGAQPIDLPGEGDGSFFFPDPFASNAYAGEERALRLAVARRKERYSRVQELKRAGIAGEGSLGYLVIRSRATRAQKKLVRKENEDRKTIYIETARERGVPVREVQRGFADVLKKRAAPGMWIETKRGWVRK